ncbi:hypothetical protein CP98_04565 [Sphingobium yanoikuyae]|mgnify:FL=1|jgi:hypothetical protein|uniref:Uncharacterized protein n=1 Tax=Sphingobium yanoikuyae TaxID=13690 RepID=A0A084EB21_SPHYA|nr:hypothetical protein CP98_04565 [Sphingobium yanoikuyae]
MPSIEMCETFWPKPEKGTKTRVEFEVTRRALPPYWQMQDRISLLELFPLRHGKLTHHAFVLVLQDMAMEQEGRF